MIDNTAKLKLVSKLMQLRARALVEYDPKQWETELSHILVNFIVSLGFPGLRVMVQETVRTFYRTEDQTTRSRQGGR